MKRDGSKTKEKAAPKRGAGLGEAPAPGPNGLPMQQLKETFDQFDTDKSGCLSLSELHHACTQLGIQCTDNSAKKVFKMIDTDESGFIDWNEFLCFFSTVSSPEQMKALLAKHNQRFLDYKYRVLHDPYVAHEFPLPPTAPLTQRYAGHESDVVSVQWFSEAQIYSASLDGTVSIWDAADRGAHPRSLRDQKLGHSGVYAMELVRSSKGLKGLMVGHGSAKDNLALYNPEDGVLMMNYSGHEKSVFCCKVSNGQNLVASGDQSGVLMVHDIDTGTVVNQWHSHENVVSTCSITKNDQRICTGSWDGHIKVWDIRQKDVSSAFIEDAAATEHVNCCMWGKDNEILSCGEDFCIKRWDLRYTTSAPVASYFGHTSGVRTLAMSSDGQLLISGSQDGSIRAWVVDEAGQRRATLTKQLQAGEKELPGLQKQYDQMVEALWAGDASKEEVEQLKNELDRRKKLQADHSIEFDKNQDNDTVKARLDLSAHKGNVNSMAWLEKADGSIALASGSGDQLVNLSEFQAAQIYDFIP